MSCSKLFKKIDELNSQYIKVWEDVCNIESPTNYKVGVDAVGNYFISIAQKFGWKIEVLEQKVSGNAICITMNDNIKNLPPICVSGHIDTVQKLGSCGNPAVKIKDGIIYGPGTSDCKGGVVAGIMAMHALSDIGFNTRPIKLIIQSDEEVNSIYSNKETIKFMCDSAKDAIAFLNLEGHEGYFEGKACLERKGILKYKLKACGKAAHASCCVTDGASAIQEACHKVLEFEKLKDDEGITCNCGVITGGSVVNTVPDSCEIHLDFRFATQKQNQWIKNYVKKVINNPNIKGCSWEILEENERLPMELVQRNVQLLEKINEIFKKCGFSELQKGKRRGGSDAAYITVSGIPCVDNLGVKGEKMHSTYEYAFIDSLKECAKRVASIIYFMD